MDQKKFKTILESETGKNLKSIDLSTLTKVQNEKLIKLAEKNKLPGYHVVKPKNKKTYLRSNPDKDKKNNLDK